MARGLTRVGLIRSLALGGAALAAACRADENAGPSAALTRGGKLRFYARTNNVEEGSRYFNQTVIARFEKLHPSVKIEGTFAGGEIIAKIGVEVAAGTAPDIFFYDQVRSPAFVQQGALKELTALIKRDVRAVADLSGSWDYFTEPDGRVFGVPATVSTSCLLYNPELFDRYGVKRPDASFSWNPRDGGAFLDAARRLTRPDQGVWGYWWTGQGTSDTMSWLKQHGGSWLDPTRTKADMLKPASLEAFQFMHDLVHRYQVSPKPQDAPVRDPGGTTENALFLTGKIAMFNCLVGQETNWDRALLAQAKIETALLPTGVKRATGSAGGPWHIYASAKEPDLAWELLKWMAGDLETQVGVWLEWKYGLPPSRKARNDPRVVQPRNHALRSLQTFLDPLEKGHAVYHEVNPVWPEWFPAFNTPFNAAMRGELAMRTAIETAQRDVQAVLDAKLPKK